MSRELLKEAIADAKAVKEAAIANAKAALEEAFTPHLKELLASKLESLEESEGMAEMKNKYNMEEGDYVEEGNYGTEKDLEELNLEEILAELEGSMNEEEDERPINEAEEDDLGDESEDSEEEEKSKKKDDDKLVGKMTGDELKDELKDLIMSVFDEMGVEVTPGNEGGMKDLESDVMTGKEAPEELEEIDLEELMLEMQMETSMTEMQGETELIGAGKTLLAILLGGGGLAYGIEKLKQNFPDIAAKLNAVGAAAGGAAHGKAGLGNRTPPDTTRMDDELDITVKNDELNEAYDTIKTLRSELNEVNLLNAKLLYTNKIFKAKNLTESQKVKVLSTFDKATTVKEVKLVFESLSTSISNSNNTAKAPIKESMGFASKASGIVKNNQTIETDAVIARMKKLAGL